MRRSPPSRTWTSSIWSKRCLAAWAAKTSVNPGSMPMPSSARRPPERQATPPAAEELTEREGHVCRALRQAAQVPRVPRLAVGDQVAHPVPVLHQADLIAGANAIQHLDLEAGLGMPRAGAVRSDPVDQLQVVRAQP